MATPEQPAPETGAEKSKGFFSNAAETLRALIGDKSAGGEVVNTEYPERSSGQPSAEAPTTADMDRLGAPIVAETRDDAKNVLADLSEHRDAANASNPAQPESPESGQDLRDAA